MKKTIIALIALGSVALGNTPDTYDAYILRNDNTSTKIQTLDNKRGQLWFNEDNATLTSWMIEFSLDKLSGGNSVLFATTFGTAGGNDERYGLSVYSWYDQSGVTIGKDGSHFAGAANLTFPVDEDTSAKEFPVTLRFAYDAVGDTAYLYCVETNTITSVNTTMDYSLNGTKVGGSADVQGLATFWTDAGADGFTVKTVTDMSSIAGKDDVFAGYVKTLKVVPEPATATLSLLALCGLAARRRRS